MRYWLGAQVFSVLRSFSLSFSEDERSPSPASGVDLISEISGG